MPKNIVLTLTGRDKIGIVDHVTKVIVKRKGNVGASRMSRLGGEFAILMLVVVPDDEFANLDQDFKKLRAEGYQVTLLQTEDDSKKYAGFPMRSKSQARIMKASSRRSRIILPRRALTSRTWIPVPRLRR